MTPDEQDEAANAAKANAATEERTEAAPADPPAADDAPAFDPVTGEVLGAAAAPETTETEAEAEAPETGTGDDDYPDEAGDEDEAPEPDTRAAPDDEPRDSGLDADTVSDLLAAPDELGGPKEDDAFELEFDDGAESDDDWAEPETPPAKPAIPEVPATEPAPSPEPRAAAPPAGEPPVAAAAEPEATEPTDASAEEEGEGDDEFADEADEESEGEIAEDETDEDTEEKVGGFSRFELLEILFSRKTKLHFAVLLGTLVLFLALSIVGSDRAVDAILLLGYGLPAGYLVTGLLTRSEAVQELCRSDRLTSLILPLVLALLVAGALYYAIEHYGMDDLEDDEARKDAREDRRGYLGWGLIGIFIVWQFAQAWWMRVPFREFALDRVRNIKLEGHSLLGRSLNITGPLVWLIVGFVIFTVMSAQGWGFDTPEEADENEAANEDSLKFDAPFKAEWLGLMLGLGALTFWLLYRLQREHATGRRVAVFSGYFALGYWAFLAYHGGVLLYSLARAPSFYFDLVLMTITILVVIYSLSVQALKSEGLINRHNVIYFSIAFTMVYGASSFFLTAGDEALIDDPKSVGRISHTIVLVSGVLVILLTNLNFMKQEGIVTGGLLINLRKPEIIQMKSMDELSDKPPESDVEAGDEGPEAAAPDENGDEATESERDD